MRINHLIILAGFVLAFTSCKKKSNIEIEKPISRPLTNTLLWTDFMSDNFNSGWTFDTEAGNWWWESSTGINWAIVHSTSTATKGRAEVSRKLTNFNGSDKEVIVKGKFKMETTADGFTNDGGWILQTMAWSFTAPSGKKEYKPLVVARMLNDKLQYLVYDYIWDAGGNPIVKANFPVIKNILVAPMAGETIELALTINLSNGASGYVKANLNGTNITSADYFGKTYPTIFPTANQQIQWKGGSYSSYYGTNHSKIGVYYLYTNQAQ